MGRLDRISNSKAADAIIVVGLVLFSAAVLNGLLMSFTNAFSFSANGDTPSLKDRVLTFLQGSVPSMAWAALVVAAGVGLRIFAQRTPPVAPSPESLAPPMPFEDVPVKLPAGGPITIDVVQSSADDDVWRR